MTCLKRILFCALCALCALCASAQSQREGLVSVAFYNLENLFDTIHDEGKNDQDFLPGGKYGWDTEKYQSKLRNMARVLGELARDRTPQGPALIGVAEAENERVLRDLTAQAPIRHLRYIHQEGPDQRGIDCALLYDPAQLTVNGMQLVESQPYQGDTSHPTRGFLIVDGQLAGEQVYVIVNHWPSRGADSPLRVHAARQVRALTDSLSTLSKQAKIIVMGDMNDDPMDESMQALGAKKLKKKVKKGEFYNPWWATLEDDGVGTLLYRGKWNLFDQIVLSKSLLGKKGLRYADSQVFRPEYLIQQDGKYKGSPLRTHGSGQWLNGYSDHLPTIVYLER